MIKNNLLIKHKRFLEEQNKKSRNNKYINFFQNYKKKNYKLINNSCLCGNKNDQVVSKVDRYSLKFDTVICRSCGLIRAPNYFDNDSVKDFYKNYYRKIMSDDSKNYTDPKNLYEEQKINAKNKFKIIDQTLKKE